jgi:hypothetical protein
MIHVTYGQNSSFNNLIKVLHESAENADGWLTKKTAQVSNQILEMWNGIRFIFGLLIFYITVFHCFCGQIIIAFLKCFFILVAPYLLQKV